MGGEKQKGFFDFSCFLLYFFCLIKKGLHSPCRKKNPLSFHIFTLFSRLKFPWAKNSEVFDTVVFRPDQLVIYCLLILARGAAGRPVAGARVGEAARASTHQPASPSAASAFRKICQRNPRSFGRSQGIPWCSMATPRTKTSNSGCLAGGGGGTTSDDNDRGKKSTTTTLELIQSRFCL